MLVIKVLGSGCANCKKVEALAHEVASELGVEAQVEKVTDPAGIFAYPIMSTPGLVMNEELVCAGRGPRKDEVAAWMKQAAG